MSAYGTFSPYCATPKGLANTVGAAPPAFATWRGVQGKTSCTLTTNVGSPPTCKGQAATRLLQALTGFQLRPLRLVLLPPRRWRGVRATKSCILPLTPWNRPNTHRRGRWIGFATCPCGLQSVSGVWGKAPRAVFFLKLLGWM